MKKADLEILANECVEDIRKGMADTKTNASGKTSAGIFAKVSDYSIEIYSNRGGFANVESGQYPGKRPRNFREIIKQWILDKGLSIAALLYSPRYNGQKKFSSAKDRGLYYAAGAIAWSNKTKGSSLYRKGGRRGVFSPAVEKLANKVADAYANDVSKQIDVIFINTQI